MSRTRARPHRGKGGAIRTARSYAALTDDNLGRLSEIAATRDEELRLARPDWCGQLLAACLVQGGARHRVHGDRGIKDLDVYLFYALPAGRRANAFPYLRGTKQRDFGDSEHGRELYSAAGRTDSKLASRIPAWEQYAGRRVDMMARAIRGDTDPRTAVLRWVETGSHEGPNLRSHSSAWHLAQSSVVCLIPEFAAVWWDGPADDEVVQAEGRSGRPLDRRLARDVD